MDHSNSADAGRERPTRLYAEAEGWRPAGGVEVEAGQPGRAGGSWTEPLR